MTKDTATKLSEAESWDDFHDAIRGKAVNLQVKAPSITPFKWFYIQFSPNGENFIVKAIDAKHAASISNELIVEHKLLTNGADIRLASDDEVNKAFAEGEGGEKNNE